MRVQTRDDDDNNDNGRTSGNDHAGDDPHDHDATEYGPLLNEAHNFGKGTRTARVPFPCLRFFSHNFRALLFLFRLANDRRDGLKFFGPTKVH